MLQIVADSDGFTMASIMMKMAHYQVTQIQLFLLPMVSQADTVLAQQLRTSPMLSVAHRPWVHGYDIHLMEPV